MHFYMTCTGNLYATSDIASWDTQCTQCGEYDDYIGYAENKEDALALFPEIMWNMRAVNSFINSIEFIGEED